MANELTEIEIFTLACSFGENEWSRGWHGQSVGNGDSERISAVYDAIAEVLAVLADARPVDVSIFKIACFLSSKEWRKELLINSDLSTQVKSMIAFNYGNLYTIATSLDVIGGEAQ